MPCTALQLVIGRAVKKPARLQRRYRHLKERSIWKIEPECLVGARIDIIAGDDCPAGRPKPYCQAARPMTNAGRRILTRNTRHYRTCPPAGARSPVWQGGSPDEDLAIADQRRIVASCDEARAHCLGQARRRLRTRTVLAVGDNDGLDPILQSD
jgi:hypothetical protein